MSADHVLRNLRVPEMPSVYLIGCLARRVTIQSQQCRAFNLVWALFEEGQLGPNARVAVVGAGIAGLTACAALIRKGCAVSLFEKSEALLSMQRGCETRFVHPHIYDWPKTGSLEANTNFPCLNWSAATGNQVVEQILESWVEFQKSKKLKLNVGKEVTEIEDDRGRTTLKIEPGFRREHFDLTIIATGFGLEPKFDNIHTAQSYWDSDWLHQPMRRPKTFLVSGCGDGGLVDVLRLRLRDFSHAQMVQKLFGSTDVEPLKDRLLEIERDAGRQESEDLASRFLYDAYALLELPNDLRSHIRGQVRSDTTVVLNGSQKVPLGLNSSILNRFAVFLLLEDERIRYISGRFDPVSVEYKGGKFSVTNQPTKELNGEFDGIVLRHGPLSTIKRFFPHLKTVSSTAEDVTQSRLWPPGFFGEATTSTPTRIDSPVPSRTCCVLLPTVGRRFQQARLRYNEVIRTIMQKAKLNCLAADETNYRKDPSSSWLKLLQKSCIVIADVTEADPQVMFEVGYRQATGKPMIILAPNRQPLPFHLSRAIVLRFSEGVGISNGLSETLAETIDKLLKTNSGHDSAIIGGLDEAIASALQSHQGFEFVSSLIANFRGDMISSGSNNRVHRKSLLQGVVSRIYGRPNTVDLLRRCIASANSYSIEAELELCLQFIQSGQALDGLATAETIISRNEARFLGSAEILKTFCEMSLRGSDSAGSPLSVPGSPSDTYFAFIQGLINLAFGNHESGGRLWDSVNRVHSGPIDNNCHPAIGLTTAYEQFLIDVLTNPSFRDLEKLKKQIDERLIIPLNAAGMYGIAELVHQYAAWVIRNPKVISSFCALGRSWRVKPDAEDLSQRMKLLIEVLAD